MSRRPYDSTVARIAGNLLNAHLSRPPGFADSLDKDIMRVVAVARAIVAETQRTEPPETVMSNPTPKRRQR